MLAALAEAAQRTGSVIVEHGNRSLAIATGLDQRTVGKILKRLANTESPLIDLVLPASGVKANAYQLVIPEHLAAAAQSKPWKKGKAHGIRAAFRELGLPAAFMFAALEQAPDALNGRDLAKDARLGVTSAYEALAVLHSWGLVERTPQGWKLGTQSLGALAESFGIVDQINNHESPPSRRRLPLVRRAQPVTAGVGVPHFGDMIISANDDPGLQEPAPGSVRPCWLAVCQACPSRAQEQLVSAVRCFGQARQGASSPGPDDRRPRQQIGNTSLDLSSRVWRHGS